MAPKDKPMFNFKSRAEPQNKQTNGAKSLPTSQPAMTQPDHLMSPMPAVTQRGPEDDAVSLFTNIDEQEASDGADDFLASAVLRGRSSLDKLRNPATEDVEDEYEIPSSPPRMKAGTKAKPAASRAPFRRSPYTHKAATSQKPATKSKPRVAKRAARWDSDGEFIPSGDLDKVAEEEDESVGNVRKTARRGKKPTVNPKPVTDDAPPLDSDQLDDLGSLPKKSKGKSKGNAISAKASKVVTKSTTEDGNTKAQTQGVSKKPTAPSRAAERRRPNHNKVPGTMVIDSTEASEGEAKDVDITRRSAAESKIPTDRKAVEDDMIFFPSDQDIHKPSPGPNPATYRESEQAHSDSDVAPYYDEAEFPMWGYIRHPNGTDDVEAQEEVEIGDIAGNLSDNAVLGENDDMEGDQGIYLNKARLAMPTASAHALSSSPVARGASQQPSLPALRHEDLELSEEEQADNRPAVLGKRKRPVESSSSITGSKRAKRTQSLAGASNAPTMKHTTSPIPAQKLQAMIDMKAAKNPYYSQQSVLPQKDRLTRQDHSPVKQSEPMIRQRGADDVFSENTSPNAARFMMNRYANELGRKSEEPDHQMPGESRNRSMAGQAQWKEAEGSPDQYQALDNTISQIGQVLVEQLRTKEEDVRDIARQYEAGVNTLVDRLERAHARQRAQLIEETEQIRLSYVQRCLSAKNEMTRLGAQLDALDMSPVFGPKDDMLAKLTELRASM